MASIHLEADVTRHIFPLTAELPNGNSTRAVTVASSVIRREMLVNSNGLPGNVAIASPSRDQVFAAVPRAQDWVAINPELAAEGAAIARDMGERAQRQYWADLVADALWDHGLGNLGHRTQSEAVIATLIQHGALR
jgi:hypothetical protein